MNEFGRFGMIPARPNSQNFQNFGRSEVFVNKPSGPVIKRGSGQSIVYTLW